MFTSIEALCQEFGLDPSDTVEALLKQLTLRRTLTLSDKTGGECASEAANNNFIRLTEAIEYLRKPATADLALLKNSELDKFAATVANLQLTVERLRLGNSPSPESESAVKKDISNSYRASKQEFCQVFQPLFVYPGIGSLRRTSRHLHRDQRRTSEAAYRW